VSVRIRETPPLRLHYELETPTGRFYRWGADEPRPENIPSGGGFTTTMPGGFDQLNVTLPRKPGVSYSDLGRLSTLRAFGAGGEIASEVRLERAPRVSGDEFSVGPEAKGWIAHLEDDPTAKEIYVGRDLGEWTELSAQWRIGWGGSFSYAGFSMAPDSHEGHPSLVLELDGAWGTQLPVAAAMYDAGTGLVIAVIDHEWTVSDTASIFVLEAYAADNDTPSGGGSLGDLATGAASGSGEMNPNKRVVAWQWFPSTGPGGGDGNQVRATLRNLAWFGHHVLTIRGERPNRGLYASDVIVDALQRWAPLLNLSTGSDGTVLPSSFIIPHLVFRDQTTPLAILEAANRYELRPYAVWENRTFHYHEWGARGRKWRTRVAPSQLSETGSSVDRLRNGVIVRFRDVDGSTRFAGPPGSHCDIEDASLLDTDPENPANQRGIRMWGPPIDMEGVSVESEVIRVGALYLRSLRETDTSGQMQLVGTVEDDRGIVHPAWKVRAGDTIVPVDASDTRERRIIRTSCTEDTFTNTVDLDAPPDGVPDLLAQLGVSVTDLGL
jgi:hypothetical protein